MITKENKKSKIALLLILGCLIGLLGGIPVGMIMQQMMLTSAAVEIGESLEGTTFDVSVDINETQMVDRIMDRFLPLINQTINQENNLG